MAYLTGYHCPCGFIIEVDAFGVGLDEEVVCPKCGQRYTLEWDDGGEDDDDPVVCWTSVPDRTQDCG